MGTSTRGYFDIDILEDEKRYEQTILSGGTVSEMFYLRDLKQRKLVIDDDIDQMEISEIVKYILQFNKEDKGKPVEAREPILLYIVSNGGDMDAGFEVIDVIQSSKTPVYTINLGYQYSMGFLIGLAGHKRFATKNAKYLMHDGSNYIFNSGAKARDQMEFNRKVEERVKQYVLSHSSITSTEYDSKLRVEWYLFADEAKEKGCVDYIIGEDCDIDAVI